MKGSWRKRAILAVGVSGAATSAFAQSCPICITAVEASKGSFIEAMRQGILLLVVPPLTLFALIGVAAYRRRNRFYYREDGCS